MAGFLGLGGSGESYFLEPDDAKTMGDIEYMRTPKKVKRTFAKTKGWGDISASERTISAYDERGGDPSMGATATPSYTPSTPTYTPPTSTYVPPAAPAPVETAPAAPVEAASTPAETAPAAEAAPEAAAPAPTPEPTPAPASTDDSMDMFRAMARKMR